MSNGLEVQAATDRRFPLVQLGFVIRGGADLDSSERRGLSALGAGLLDEGTGDATAQDIAEFVERRGAELVSAGDWDGIYVGASSLAPHAEALLDLLSRILRSPSFPGAELERLRSMRLADLANRATQPAFVAARHAVEMTYGADHPYGDTFLGTSETVNAITLDDVHSWHADRLHPDRTLLVAAGDVDLAQLASWAEAHLADWREEAKIELPPVPSAPTRSRVIRIVDRPDAAQTELRLARQGSPRAAADYLEARVLSLLFGGKFTSRLNLNLRERLGITYGVNSRLSGRRGAGPFTVGCAVDTGAAGTAVGEILSEMDALAEAAPTEEEVEDTKNYLLGTFPYELQTLDGVVEHLEELVLYDLPRDTFHRLPEQVARITPEAVHAVARRLLETRDIAIVAVGPAAELEPFLAPHGPTETVSSRP